MVAARSLLRDRVVTRAVGQAHEALPCAVVSADADSARRDWEQGYRALLAAPEGSASDRLHDQVDVVTGELRKRVGSTFTLAELARVYAGSERWLREVIAENGATPGWPRTATLAGDAAFHLYARGAQDYAP